jgi:hypothetical protein
MVGVEVITRFWNALAIRAGRESRPFRVGLRRSRKPLFSATNCEQESAGLPISAGSGRGDVPPDVRGIRQTGDTRRDRRHAGVLGRGLFALVRGAVAQVVRQDELTLPVRPRLRLGRFRLR